MKTEEKYLLKEVKILNDVRFCHATKNTVKKIKDQLKDITGFDIKSLNKLFEELLNNAYQDGYDSGYDSGYGAGVSEYDKDYDYD